MAEDDREHDDDADDEPEGGEGGGGGGDGGGGGRPLVERMDQLESKLDSILERLAPGQGSDGSPAGAAPPGGPLRAEEHNWEGRVRGALGKIRDDEEVKERLAKLEQRVPEQAPVKQRRSERVMWGSRD